LGESIGAEKCRVGKPRRLAASQPCAAWVKK
jgi:hypothetical protein